MPIHPDAAVHADTGPPAEGERYTAAQLYARLLREPPEAAMELLRLLAGAAQDGAHCFEQDHLGAVIQNRQLTRELQERAEREATYILDWDDEELTVRHLPCGAEVASTWVGRYASRACRELGNPTTVVELSAAIASHRCPQAEEEPCATTAPSSLT